MKLKTLIKPVLVRNPDLAHISSEKQTQYVAKMFSSASRKYDLMNTIMTAGRHHAWRRILIDSLANSNTGIALDVATGTGDVAMDLAKTSSVTKVVGIDLVPEMLNLASHKTKQKGLENHINYTLGNAQDLPFSDNKFTCATVAFGIRNFADRNKALKELSRVVKPGGYISILEIVRTNKNTLAGTLFPIYFRYITPLLGAILVGNREAYTYLPKSVQSFLSAEELASLARCSGLKSVSLQKMALGAIAIVVGQNPL